MIIRNVACCIRVHKKQWKSFSGCPCYFLLKLIQIFHMVHTENLGQWSLHSGQLFSDGVVLPFLFSTLCITCTLWVKVAVSGRKEQILPCMLWSTNIVLGGKNFLRFLRIKTSLSVWQHLFWRDYCCMFGGTFWRSDRHICTREEKGRECKKGVVCGQHCLLCLRKSR